MGPEDPQESHSDDLRSSSGPFQDDSLVLPLSPESFIQIPDIIRLLNTIFLEAPLYPKISDVTLKMVDELFSYLDRVLSRDAELIFEANNRIIFVNGQRLNESDIKKVVAQSFLMFFEGLQLRNIIFNRGLTKVEFMRFVDCLCEGALEFRKLSEHIERSNIRHIIFNQHQSYSKERRLPDLAKDLKGIEDFLTLSLDQKIQKIKQLNDGEYLVLRKTVDINEFLRELIVSSHASFNDLMDAWDVKSETCARDEKIALAHDLAWAISMIPQDQVGLKERHIDRILQKILRQTDAFVLRTLSKQLADVLESQSHKDHGESLRIAYERIEHFSSESLEAKKTFEEFTLFLDQIFNHELLALVVDEYVKQTSQGQRSMALLDLFTRVGRPAIIALIDVALPEERLLKTVGYFNVFMRRRIIGEALTLIVKKVGDREVIEILKAHLKSPRWYDAKNITELLIDIDCPSIRRLLEESLRHSDDRVKRKAIFILGKIEDEISLELLHGAFMQNIGKVRLDILSVLGRIGNEQTLKMLERSVHRDLQSEIKQTVDALKQRLK